MKTNPELFNKHFEEYKEWVISHKKFPTLSDEAKFSDGILMQRWRANCKSKIMEFENSMKEIISQKNLANKQLKHDAEIFEKYVDINKCYPWEPKTLQEYLDGDNRYHFYSIDTYISLMKYVNEPLNEKGWFLFYKSLFGDDGINNTFIGDKEKFEMFMEISMEVFSTLTDREYQALCIRFGLNDGCQKSLDIVGQELNVTPERIRQIVAKAFRKLHHPSRFNKFRILDQIHDDELDVNHGIGHWFILCYDGKKTVVKRNTAELEEVLEQEGFDYSVPFGSCKIISVKSYTHYGYQIDHEIRLLIDELLNSSSNYKIFNYTEVSLTKQKPIKTVKEYVDEYCEEVIEYQEKEQRRLAKISYQKENPGIENMYPLWCGTPSARTSMFPMFTNELSSSYREFLDESTSMFNEQFPDKVKEIVDSLEFDEDHNWIKMFNKCIRQYYIPFDCYNIAARTLKKCLDIHLNDYAIEVLFKAPNPNDHYMHINYISDTSEMVNANRSEVNDDGKKE